jgi:DNA helicase HerA-like ATPase
MGVEFIREVLMEQFVERFDEHLLFALERRYLDFIDPERLELAMNPAMDAFDYRSHLRMIRLDEVSHEGNDREGLHLLHMQNVLAAMKDDSHTLISIVRGQGGVASLYYGLAHRFGSQAAVSTHEYARMLGATMHGNFLGARFTPLSADETWDQVIAPLAEHGHALAFPGIPSLRVREPDAPYVQGIDRFIEGMRGEDYCLVIIAEPIQLPTVDGMITNLFDLGSSVHAQVRSTIQNMKGSSDTVNVGMFGFHGTGGAATEGTADTDGTTTTEGTAETTTESDADTTTRGTARTDTHGRADTATRMGGGGAMAGASGTIGATLGGIVGTIVAPGIGTAIGAAVGGTLGGALGPVAAWLTGTPLTNSATISSGDATTTSEGLSHTDSLAHSLTHSSAFSKASSFTRSVANTASSMTGLGGMGGYARGWNRSVTMGREELNKTAEHCEKLTDAYVHRLQKGKNLGFWNAGVYLLTKNKYTQLRAQGLLRACLSGDDTHWEPVRSVHVNPEALGQYLVNFNNPRYNLFLYGEETRNVEQSVSVGRKIAQYASRLGKSVGDLLGLLQKVDPKERIRMLEEIRRCPGDYPKEAIDQAWAQIKDVQLGHPLGPALGGVSTPLNTEELSIIMNVPRQEVQGVTIRPSTSFGVNYDTCDQPDSIRLGRVVHKREPVDSMPYLLPRDLLQKHLFVCGVTGSGKTNTCMGLLRNLDLPFMVIEPAKTEYRQMLADMPNLKVFTLGGETVSPFRINPFEFSPGCNLLTHVDNLKSVFSAAFPMYAAMPYILEEAIIGVYQDKGWELATSTNVYLHGAATQSDVDLRFYDFLPTMQDLFEKIDDVVSGKEYALEQTMNYSAALKARISSLLTGSKGLMLNTRRSTPMETLLGEHVVLELKHIGDDEEKCFLMGLILSAIYEYREEHARPGEVLNHVLLIEEAHRLLRRVPDYVSPEVGNTRGKAVETFSNVISEIRTLGQGVVVVDQIPSKLTQDVIKNTNMKIVHRTLAKDDRDYVGSAMNLTDAQSRELSLLEVGRAVIHREGMDKAFLVQIDRFGRDDPIFVTDQAIIEAMQPFHAANAFVFRRYPGFEKNPDIPRTYARMDFRKLDRDIYFAVMGAFVLMLLEEMASLPALRKNFNALVARRTRRDSEVEQACHVIHYAALLFSELNAKYPGCYDRCLAMNQAFADLWFEEAGTMEPREAHLTASKLRQDMRYLRQDDRLTIPFFAYHINRMDSETPHRIRETWTGTEKDLRNLDGYLRDVVFSLLSGVPIPESKAWTLVCDFLEMIFWTDPRRTAILKQYQQVRGCTETEAAV